MDTQISFNTLGKIEIEVKEVIDECYKWMGIQKSQLSYIRGAHFLIGITLVHLN